MTEPTEPDREEGWTDGPTEDLGARVELLEIAAGVADIVRWIDPDDEGPGRPAGLEKCEPVGLLDLMGHIHPPMEAVDAGVAPPCIPVRAPFQFDLETMDDLIKGLTLARAELARRLEAIGQDS